MSDRDRYVRDVHWMRRALQLAADSVGLASPNPQVGCVLVRTPKGPGMADAKVIGEGAHLYANLDHAEIVALNQARARNLSTAGATAYVTLEPCSHHGRTPPCADAFIAGGISRVVVATADPNPLVAGQGIARLRAAGIEVTVGICQQQARDQNDAFACFIQTRTPLVTLKAALSADGKLAPPPASRLPNQPHWLTGPAARYEVQRLRRASDAILTGIGTVLADDPALTDRSGVPNPALGGVPSPNFLPRRRPLLRVVLDTHLRTPLHSQLVKTARRADGSKTEDLLIFCSTAASTSKITALEAAGAEVVLLPQHAARLSLPAVLASLAERQILSLLVEAGSHLNGAFLSQNLVDKVVLFYTLAELGTAALPFATGYPSPLLFQQSLNRITRTTIGSDTCITGYLHDPWSPAQPIPRSL